MPYTLTQAAVAQMEQPEVTIAEGKTCESFFLYFQFVITAATRVVTVNYGRFAAYVSGTTSEAHFEPPWAGPQNLQISDTGMQQVTLSHVQHVRSRPVGFSNEESRLHLWEFVPHTPAATWLNEGAYTPPFTAPNSNRDGATFRGRALTCGAAVQSRYAYTVLSGEDVGGTAMLAVVMPYLNSSVAATILTHDNRVLPTLILERPVLGNWVYPPAGSTALPGDAVGYVLVAQGAFKAIDLSSELDDWYIPAAAQVTHEQFAARLAALAHRAASQRLSRNLETAHDNDHNAVIHASPDMPVEVLYLKDLNTINPVLPVSRSR
jgi:hypothetical protein